MHHTLPLCTWEGNKELRIENYGVLGDFSEKKIVLRCSKKKLIVEGSHLNIEYFTNIEMMIKGCICCLRYEDCL